MQDINSPRAKHETHMRQRAATDLGKIAYDAYKVNVGGKSLITGDPLPIFFMLSPQIQKAWRVAGEAVVESFKKGDK